MSLRYWIGACALFLPGLAFSQPTLESLWPNANGLRWEYEFVNTGTWDPSFTVPAALWLDGTVETPGGTAQVLHGAHAVPAKARPGAADDPVLRAIWRARPDLRPAIEARTGRSLEDTPGWWPLLLHDGYFMRNPTNIQMWQETWNHPTWTYMTDNLTVGATFTQQLLPEIADNVFLHGTVEANDVTVSTVHGTYEHAVRIGYLVDYGLSDVVDPNTLQVIGRARSETRGHVHFVPEVGPVEMLEDFFPYVEIDCAPNDCPPEWIDLLGVSVATRTLSLMLDPVSVESTTWSTVKSLYRP